MPSTAIPFVSTMLSPALAPEVSTTRSFATSPSIAPATIGPRQVVRDLGVAADKGHVVLPARLRQLVEYGLHHHPVRALGQQHRRHEPPRRRPHHRQVVGVHLHHVPADQVRREGNGVALRDQVPVAEVDQRGVLAGPRPEDDPRIPDLQPAQHLGKQLER